MGAGAQYDVFDFRPDRARSDFRGSGSWRSGESTLLFARFAAGLFLLFGAPPRPPISPRVRRSCGFKAGTTADHDTATLLSLNVGAVGAANRIMFWKRVLGLIASLPSHIKNSPPVYDLADEAQWVATTFG